ncbi:MAG: gliding motility-associated C-terminal domain-containing protein, partial [Saprospiraceae bacterium]|nr:gliding motility-associated C-terminal domain-containing protein [Saprospiraceae bacterium]
MQAIYLRFSPLFFSFFLIPSLQAQICNISFQCGNESSASGGFDSVLGSFCEGENTLFENNSDPNLVDSTFIYWGDGTFDAYLGTPDMPHVYDFSFDTCLTSGNALNLQVTMITRRYCPAGITEACIITFIQVKVDPYALFSLPDEVCVNQPFSPSNFTCENADTASYSWTIDGTFYSNEYSPSIIFDTPGIHTIGMTATNECGDDGFQQTILVRDLPESEFEFDPNLDGGCVDLVVPFTDLSLEADNYSWTISPSGGWEFIDSTTSGFDNPVVEFTVGGVYEVCLTVSNICGSSVFCDSIFVQVPPEAAIDPVDPFCDMGLYTPSAVFGGNYNTVEWTFINGNPGTFSGENPPEITYGNSGLAIVEVVGDCGIVIDTQEVEVIVVGVIDFCDPLPVFCLNSDPIQLCVNPVSGVWSGPGVDSDGLFTPSDAGVGVHAISYEIGGGTECLNTGVLQIEVEDVGASFLPPDALCIDTDPFDLIGTPIGGTFDGPGIVDPDLGTYSAEAAGPGLHTLMYNFSGSCIANFATEIEIIENPNLEVLDTTLICLTPNSVNLTNLVVVANDPNTGVFEWNGIGIVDDVLGLFDGNAAGGIGTYEVEVLYTIDPFCISRDTTVVEVTAYEEAETPDLFEFCTSEGIVQLTGTPGNGTWSGGTINPDGTLNVGALAAGTYTYNYVIQAGTVCESATQSDVNVINAASVDVGNNLFACETELIATLPAIASPGSWSGPFLQNGNEVDVVSAGPGQYTYTFTASNIPEACASDSLVLTIAALPEIMVDYPDTVCIGELVTFTNLTINATNYQWDLGNGDMPTAVSPSTMYDTEGTYTITLNAFTVVPSNSLPFCPQTWTGEIVVLPPPEQGSFTMDIEMGCPPLLVSFLNTSIVDAATSYVWDFGNGQTSTAINPMDIEFLGGVGDTSYYVSLTVANLCQAVAFTDTVTVLALAQADFGLTDYTPCSGDTIQINNTSTGNPDSYLWIFSDLSEYVSVNPPPYVPFTGNAPTQDSVILISTNLCNTDTLVQYFDVNPTDVTALLIANENEVCVGEALSFGSASTPGAINSWWISDETTYLGDSITHVFATAGDYEVVLYANGCGFDSMTVDVTVLPLPSGALVYDNPVCAGTPADFMLTTDASGHTLYFGTGDSTFQNTIQYTYPTSGAFTIDLELESDAGCLNNASYPILIQPLPIPAALPPDSLCVGELGNFVSQSTGTQSCLWDFGDNQISDLCVTQHAFAEAGIQAVTLTAISPAGCVDSILVPVYVRISPVADFNFLLDFDCTPASVQFLNQSLNATGYDWEIASGIHTDETDPFYTYYQGGIQLVTLVASREQICFDTITQSFEIFPTPMPIVSFEDLRCRAEDPFVVSVENLAPGEIAELTGPDYKELGVDRFEVFNAGTYELIVSSAAGCDTTINFQVADALHLELLTRPDTTIRLGESVLLNTSANVQDLDINWSPAGSLDDATILSPLAMPFQTTTYVISAYDSLCLKTDTVEVRVLEDRSIYFPNAISPNDDGINDYYRIHVGPAVVALTYFKIFDRFGEMVYEVIDPELLAGGFFETWDGRHRGEYMNPQVFTWIAEVVYIDGEKEFVAGDLVII